MKREDKTVDRSDAQKRLRVELARIELRPWGYSVVRTSWLQETIKRLPPGDGAQASIEAAR